jgi:hypothetical protein
MKTDQTQKALFTYDTGVNQVRGEVQKFSFGVKPH